MQLPFLDRREELGRLRRALQRREASLAVVYGRRRCGKSRLLRETLSARPTLYYVGDERESVLQRGAFAAAVAGAMPGFDRVTYPDWDALFTRVWEQAPRGTVLVLDEFPSLVTAAREIPGLLQKQVDRHAKRGVHLVLAGSSQRMMHGLVLDRTAPLYGRATEILKIHPLPAGWIRRALRLAGHEDAVVNYAVWGGVPRYWELALEHAGLESAMRELVLSPLGVLHDEPIGLLLEDMRDVAQAASIASLVGQGCHRLSEIAARLEKPATSLTRPLQRLVDLELIEREIPFGSSARDSRRSLYRIADPFLAFWFRFVEPQRSRLEAGQIAPVCRETLRALPQHVAGVWEDLARASVPRLEIHGRTWRPASRWWGPGIDHRPMEIDIVAESEDRRALLLGEAQWSGREHAANLQGELRRKAANFPLTRGREVCLAIWLKTTGRPTRDAEIVTPKRVLDALR
jgi:hypothetical protein